MRRGTLLAALAFALMAGIVVYAGRIADRLPGARADLAREKSFALDAAAVERLRALADDVLVTYYVSAAERMPSRLKRLEQEVVARLEELSAASGGRLAWQIVDPETRPELLDHASRLGIAPFRVREVRDDRFVESTIWSSLSVAYGPRPDGIVRALLPEHLPRLAGLILGLLEQAESPRAPVFVVAGDRTDGLAGHLADRGEVRRVDLDAGAPLPPDGDLLFWLRPEEIPDARLGELEAWLRSGRSAVVAASARRAQVRVDEAGTPLDVRFVPQPYGAEALFAAYGLAPLDRLVADAMGLARVDDGPVLSYALRCIAPNQDFRPLSKVARGSLLFEAPTPLRVDPDRLADLGLAADVLATTSPRVAVRPWPDGPIAVEDLPTGEERDAAKLPLMVAVRGDDPWRGTLVAAAAATPFEQIDAPNLAHRVLVDTLVDAFASGDRLVLHDQAPRPPRLPELAAGERLRWRLLVVGGPAALLALALLLFGGRARRGAGRRGIAWGRLAAVVAGVVALTTLARAVHVRADWSADALSRPSATTLALARDVDDLTIELIFDDLPAELAPVRRRARELAREIVAATPGARLAASAPDESLRPRLMRSPGDEAGGLRRVHSTVRLSAGGRSETLGFLDRRAADGLEFRFAFALRRLATGRTPKVAFMPDNPRLSAAEAYEDYQKQGLFAPTGTSVYSRAAALLEEAGFAVEHVDPRQPEVPLPDDADLLVWMQPRRDAKPALEAFARHLHEGKPGLLAAQHFNMQSRQYQGAAFDVVFWPQPQVADVQHHYWPRLGIELERQLLLDRNFAPLEVVTQVNRRNAERVYERQTTSQPFQIRAIAEHMDPDHVVTRRLGDQFFVWGARFVLDEERLAELGLTARPIIGTSDRAWRFDWQGGYVPDHVLAGPPAEGQEYLDGSQPLALWVEGPFPRWEPPTDETEGAVVAEPGTPKTRLLLVGGSELFKNELIFRDGFQHDQLLLNAAATLALGDDLGAVAARRPSARGFGELDPGDGLLWRGVVLGLAPLLLLVGGLATAPARRRPLRIGGRS